MSYAFVFRAYPDIDHMAPLAWKLLDEGEEVHAIVSLGYDPHGDYRLQFLATYPGFHLHEVRASRGGAGGWRRPLAAARELLCASLPYALTFLVRRRVRVVAVEWGYGLVEGYERPLSAAGVVAILRSIAGSIRRVRDPQQVRTNFIVAARLLGRPTVCLPHGLSVKLDATTSTAQLAGEGEPPRTYDWRDRNRFAAYVLNTEHHRRWFIEYAMGDPRVVETWGSLRWAPEWFELNRRLAPPFTWPGDPGDRLKVVYMVPKWGNRVRTDAAIGLLKSLQSLPFVSLALKAHPRPEDGSADPLHADPGIDWGRVHDVSATDSVSVIQAADVVIDAGSSIGLEVVMQGKVLLNPAYIHELTTLFDELPGVAVTCHGADEVIGYLRAHAEGSPHRIDAETYDELLRRAVYGSRPAPFDVVGDYSRRVRELARASSAGNGHAHPQPSIPRS